MWLPQEHPLLENLSHNQACALTGNLAGDLWLVGQRPTYGATQSGLGVLFCFVLFLIK